jgi:hypothetical protein
MNTYVAPKHRMLDPSLTLQQLGKEYIEYMTGLPAICRFGQRMLNKYLLEGSWPEVYYANSSITAYNLLVKEIENPSSVRMMDDCFK